MTTCSRIAGWIAPLLLAGCGGGVYLGYTWGDNDPPRVGLVASASDVTAGQTVRLTAAAADDSGYVDRVIFYRYDGNSLVSLGTDLAPPFETVLVVPSDGRLSLNLLAQAVDGDGEVGTSEVLSLAVR